MEFEKPSVVSNGKPATISVTCRPAMPELNSRAQVDERSDNLPAAEARSHEPPPAAGTAQDRRTD